MPTIKVKAFAVLLDEGRTRHLVWRGGDRSRSTTHFHRLLGGHVEFGESSAEAVVREIDEEVGTALLEPELLGVLESRYVQEGEPGHEIVFVYAAGWPTLTSSARTVPGWPTTVTPSGWSGVRWTAPASTCRSTPTACRT